MAVIDDVFLLPILDPIAHPESFHLSVCGRADDAIQAGVDDHFFADKAGEGVYRLGFSRQAAENVHVPP